MKKLFLLTVLALAACASVQGDVDALAASMTIAETAVQSYVLLPLCGSIPAGQPCADISVLQKIDQARSVAWTAISAANTAQTQTAITAAQTALAAFQTIIATVVGGKPA